MSLKSTTNIIIFWHPLTVWIYESNNLDFLFFFLMRQNKKYIDSRGFYFPPLARKDGRPAYYTTNSKKKKNCSPPATKLLFCSKKCTWKIHPTLVAVSNHFIKFPVPYIQMIYFFKQPLNVTSNTTWLKSPLFLGSECKIFKLITVCLKYVLINPASN